jgi:hypothetical protein
VLRYAAAWLAGALPAFLIITLLWLYPGRTTPFGYVALGAFALAFPVMVRRLKVPRRTEFVYFLLFAGIAFSVISILTGWGNGLTDEPFTTPRFAGFTLSGHDPYVSELVFNYQQYGKTLSSTSYYLYLPLLMFLQIPGIDYKWFTVGCWVLMVLLARNRFDTASLLAQPYVMLIAASGYNDLPVLLLLTVGFVGIEGRRQKWAEYLSLGCKQFANAFVVLYYLARRRWRDTLVTVGVSAAFLVPFLLWSGPAIICPAVFADRLSGCAAGSNAALLLNYPVWAVWVVGVFYLPVLAALRSWSTHPEVAGRLTRWRIDPTRVRGIPSIVIVGASAILAGLSAFVVASLAFGDTLGETLAAGAVALAVAAVWSLSWNTTVPGRSGIRRSLAAQFVTIVLGFPILAVGVAAGAPALASVGAGLAVGILVSSALIVRWGLESGPAFQGAAKQS